MSSRHFNRYLIVSITSLVVFLSLVLLFNYFVDPYSIFNSPRIKGFNDAKYCANNNTRMAKAHNIQNLEPHSIILGTSRAYAGLDPEHPGIGPAPVYNAALTGATIYETMRYFQHANAIQPLKQVVLAVDFFQFNMNLNNSPDFTEDRLVTTPDGSLREGYYNPDALSALASIDATSCSMQTLAMDPREHSFMLANGLRDSHYQQVLGQRFGLRSRFQKGVSNYLSAQCSRTQEEAYSFTNPQTGKTSFDYFASILSDAQRNGIDLRIAISPSHAWLWTAMHYAGLSEKWDQWKRELVRINQEVSLASGNAPFPLLDFSGYNRYTTENVPPHQDRTSSMQWYWENSHYRVELGNLVLQRILSNDFENQDPLDSFGVLLSPGNIDSHLRKARRNRERYLTSHPGDREDIAELFRKHCSSVDQQSL